MIIASFEITSRNPDVEIRNSGSRLLSTLRMWASFEEEANAIWTTRPYRAAAAATLHPERAVLSRHLVQQTDRTP